MSVCPVSIRRVVLLGVAVLAGLAVVGAPDLAPAARAASAALHEQLLVLVRASRNVRAPALADIDPRHAVYNAEAPVPAQCYTRTEGTHNPCYVCHQAPLPGRENTLDDGHLQTGYAFSDVGLTNHWRNLFLDRRQAAADITDAQILAWVDEDNYSALAPRLREAGFQGWIPDLAGLERGKEAFDEHGHARDGSGWVAYNYKPFPSTFWPTNGSFGDAMIRLPEAFRSDAQGRPSADVYRANLAIVEAQIKGLTHIGMPAVDERAAGGDLDGDGTLGHATWLRRVDRYVGAAAGRHVEPYLYPEGTELLHTVRYLGFTPDGSVVPSRRMKEVRYLRKWRYYPKATYARTYELERYAKDSGALPQYLPIGDHGLDNGYGWSVQGFIEDAGGALRTLTYEENLFCMGCHAAVGSTIDKTFSLPRKPDGAAGWGYVNLRGMPDAPSMGHSAGEFAVYLARAGGGSEFRANAEMQARFFDPDGGVNAAAVRAAADVYDLIVPSPQRALALNKAYRVLVDAQEWIFGRDVFLAPPENVYRAVDPATAPTLPPQRSFAYDLRLDWAAAAR
jgi:hypothetical protein